MAMTRRELIDIVLDNLGVLVPGQAPSDDEVDKVDKRFDAGFAQLAASDIIAVYDFGTPSPPSGGEIEDAIVLPLGDWFAWKCAPAFNQADNPSLKILADEAEKVLRLIGRPASTRRVLITDPQLSSRPYRNVNFLRGT
jgi:hypothetical protein